MILGLETNLSFLQFLLLAILFIAILGIAYFLLSSLWRQESKKPGRNWNVIGVLALLLPPIMGLGAVLGISMFSFFLTELHNIQTDIQKRVFIRNLQPRERQLRTSLTGSNAVEGLIHLQTFLMETERQERNWDNPEMWKMFERWNQCYLGLLFMAGNYQEIISWDSTRVMRYPNISVFPATMAVAKEAMGKDGSFWVGYVESSGLSGPAVDFMKGFIARNYGKPDSAMMYIRVGDFEPGAVDFLSIASLGELVRAQTDVGWYDEARSTFILRLEPILWQSSYPLLESYLETTRSYLEIHYYLSKNINALPTLDVVENQLQQAITKNPGYTEPWMLIAMYRYLTQDKTKADYYFNDIKARSPWKVVAIERFLTVMRQNTSPTFTSVHSYLMQSMYDGLNGQLKEIASATETEPQKAKPKAVSQKSKTGSKKARRK